MNSVYMRRKKVRFRLTIMFLAVMCQFLIVMNVRASEVDAVTTIPKNQGGVSAICNSANSVTMGKKILVYNSSEGTLSFSNSKYSELDFDTKRAFMKQALLSTKESKLGVQVKNKVYNFIAEQDSAVSAAMKFLKSDTSADFAEAKIWFLPFSSPISTVMGVLCLLIFVFMGTSIVWDSAYMVLPGAQGLLERGEPNKRPFGVSKEAWKANRLAEEDLTSSGVMGIYIKMRLPLIILTAACLGYLITGKIYDVMVYFIDAFS